MLQQTEISKSGVNNLNVSEESKVVTPQLLDFGLTKNESSTYQKIASIPGTNSGTARSSGNQWYRR